jgi:hypothetical protein
VWLALAAPSINLTDDRHEAAEGEPHVDLVECREPIGQTLLATCGLSTANMIHAWMYNKQEAAILRRHARDVFATIRPLYLRFLRNHDITHNIIWTLMQTHTHTRAHVLKHFSHPSGDVETTSPKTHRSPNTFRLRTQAAHGTMLWITQEQKSSFQKLLQRLLPNFKMICVMCFFLCMYKRQLV